MAKTYSSAIKYEIQATYEVDGIVEKPDIIGAIFGQSEGLLGEDMDLKELQQSGKLGRIEITVNKQKGKTIGEIIIPSSLDQIKTSILAATIETVEKVGPCNTIIKVLKIIDTRKEKREIITDRAKQLLTRMQKFEGIETTEIADNIKSQIRTAKIISLNGLPAGPEAQKSKEIIIVEGRADVLKLLSYGINNVVAMNGSNIEPALIELCKQKTTIMLVDGDRGGELNAKKLNSLTNVNFIAKAPDGKEVEELTQKEILQSLKRKMLAKDFLNEKTFNPKQTSSFEPRQNYNKFGNNYKQPYQQQNNYRQPYQQQNSYRQPTNNRFQQRNDYQWKPRTFDSYDPFKGNYRKPSNTLTTNKPITQIKEEVKTIAPTKTMPTRTIPIPTKTTTKKIITTPTKTITKTIKEIETNNEVFNKDYEKLRGKLKARFYDNKNKKIKDVDVKDIISAIEKNKTKVHSILLDGIITKRLIETAEKHNIQNLWGPKKSPTQSKTVNIQTITQKTTKK